MSTTLFSGMNSCVGDVRRIDRSCFFRPSDVRKTPQIERDDLIAKFVIRVEVKLDHLIAEANVRTGCRSLQFGRTSAPRWPQRSQRRRGPNDGTGKSSL